jgi:hypothetical protein
MLRIPYSLDNRLTDKSEIASLANRPRSILQKHFKILFGIHFCERLTKYQVLVRPEQLGKLMKLSYHIFFRTRDLPACSIVPQPLRYR